jgi:chromosome segregation ATPase
VNTELLELLPQAGGSLAFLVGIYVLLMRSGVQAVQVRNETNMAVLTGWQEERKEARDYARKYEAAIAELANMRVEIATMQAELVRIPELTAQIDALQRRVTQLEADLLKERQRAERAENKVRELRAELDGIRRTANKNEAERLAATARAQEAAAARAAVETKAAEMAALNDAQKGALESKLSEGEGDADG